MREHSHRHTTYRIVVSMVQDLMVLFRLCETSPRSMK